MMASDFGEGWVSSPLERWAAILLKSGILFWLGGLAAWVSDWDWESEFWNIEWLTLWERLGGFLKPVPALLGIFMVIVLVAAFSSILSRSDLPVLRFLEGYHRHPRRFWNWLMRRRELEFEEQENRYQELSGRHEDAPDTLNKSELRELAQLEWRLECIPNDERERMPTRLGNLLRATELRPREKYGLNAFVCWPRLWLVLPDHVKRELAEARDHLDSTVRIWTWSALFIIWTIWTLWAVPVSIVGMWLAYRWIFQAAKTYGQLVESAFDLHRHLLYKSLRWPLPENPADEKQDGEKLTAYLFRGSDKSDPVFVK